MNNASWHLEDIPAGYFAPFLATRPLSSLLPVYSGSVVLFTTRGFANNARVAISVPSTEDHHYDVRFQTVVFSDDDNVYTLTVSLRLLEAVRLLQDVYLSQSEVIHHVISHQSVHSQFLKLQDSRGNEKIGTVDWLLAVKECLKGTASRYRMRDYVAVAGPCMSRCLAVTIVMMIPLYRIASFATVHGSLPPL
jgi:hypothetical protein